MNQENTKKLLEAFPLLYKGRTLPLTQCLMAFGFECGDGWFKIIWDLSEKIEAIIKAMPPEQEEWTEYPFAMQVKEKFGGLRFYMSCTTDDIENAIRDAANLAEVTCEHCGTTGENKADRGWWQVLCPTCRETK